MSVPVSDRIPILDIGAFLAGEAGARERLGRDVAKAAGDTGFMVVVNHGVPRALIDECFAAARQFFDRDEAYKLALKAGNLNIGYLPYPPRTQPAGTDAMAPKPSLNETFISSTICRRTILVLSPVTRSMA